MLMRKVMAWKVFVLCGCLVTLATGCAKPLSQPAVAPASGVVTYKGSPVPNAEVLFKPGDSTATAVATGRTDQNGMFQLSTFGINDGCIPGDKVVVIAADERGGKKIQPGEPEPGSPGYVAPKDLIPKKYFSEATSGLKATVVAGKENRFEFALTDEKK
jgi:hypothetical protein